MEQEILHATEYLQTEDGINIHKSIVESHYGQHTHDFIEMAFITAGSGTHVVNGEKYDIRKGDLFILNVNVTHEFTAHPGMPLTVYNCIFQPLFIDAFFTGCKNFIDVAYHYLFHSLSSEYDPKGYIKLTGTDTMEIENLLEEMYVEYTNKEDGFMRVIKSDITKLLILVFRLYKNDTKQEHSSTLFKRLVIQNAVEYINQNYSSNIKCEFLASRAYLSVSYFGKIFKEVTGMTVIQKLQCVRIKAACELLQNSLFSVVDIAHRVGYSDSKHFYKVFQQVKSINPGEYRRRHNGIPPHRK